MKRIMCFKGKNKSFKQYLDEAIKNLEEKEKSDRTAATVKATK